MRGNRRYYIGKRAICQGCALLVIAHISPETRRMRKKALTRCSLRWMQLAVRAIESRLYARKKLIKRAKWVKMCILAAN